MTQTPPEVSTPDANALTPAQQAWRTAVDAVVATAKAELPPDCESRIDRARELVLSARTFPAEEAERMGLVTEVVPGEQLTSRARAIAAAMAECPPEVLAAAKRALEFGEAHGMEESMRNEERTSAELRRARGR